MKITEKERGYVVEDCPHGDKHITGWAVWEFDFSNSPKPTKESKQE